MANVILAGAIAGVDASEKIQKAIGLLALFGGGTVDARDLVDVTTGGGSTAIDPGTTAVTLLLGPTTYYVSQIILEANFHIHSDCWWWGFHKFMYRNSLAGNRRGKRFRRSQFQ